VPVPTETLHNIKRMNVIFALTSLATLGTMGWMLWHDYDHPWRHMQTNYFNLRSAMAHFDVLKFDSPDEQKKHSVLKERVTKAESELAGEDKKRYEKEKVQKEKELAGKLQAISLTYGNMNAELQVKLFNVEEFKTLHGPHDPKTLAAKEDYDKSVTALAAMKATQDKLEDDLREVRNELKSLYKERNDAQKALVAYEKGRNDAQRLDDMFGPGFSRTALNIPLLDFAAPKGVPGRQEIKQVFSKSIRFNYNFVDSYVTDRCMTCHVGIDDPTYTMDAFVARTAAALQTQRVTDVLREENDKLGREMVRRLADVNISDYAQGDRPKDDASKLPFIRAFVNAANDYLSEIKRPVLKADDMKSLEGEKELTRGKVQDAIDSRFRMILAAAPPKSPDGKRTLTYKDMTPAQQTAYLASMTAAMNLYLQHEGRPEIDFKSELRAHPHLDLYLSPDSPHSMKTMGCTVCHEGSGQETDFVLAAHTPKDKEEKHKWEKEYYTRELGVPLATFHLVEEYWERPMLLPQYTSASCRKCHDQVFDLERHKTLKLASSDPIIEGRQLFTQVGCINCHNVEGLTNSRRVGPDLAHVGEKLSTGFMERWIEYPGSFRPSTWMPHFFHQENNLPSSANEFDPDPMLRMETEIQAMAQYLTTFTTPYNPVPLPSGINGDAKHGEELFVSIGCLACHSNLDAKDPLDSNGKTFAERWITQDLAMVKGLSAEDAKKHFDEMSKNDRARYAMRNFTAERREKSTATAAQEQLAADREGRDPDAKIMYIPPAFTRIAPELSGLGTKLVNDPNDTAETEKAQTWLYNWLREPRHYSSYTKMPRLFRDDYYWNSPHGEQRKKNDQDIMDVAAFLLSLRNDEFKPTPFQEDSAHEELRNKLILSILLGQNTQSVSTKILNDERISTSDPYGKLTSAIIAQTQNSLGGGERGTAQAMHLLQERAPKLADRQRLYLGMKMIGHYGCYACHNIAGFEDATRPGTDLSLWAQKFMSQLDFAFFSPPFEHEIAEQPEIFGNLYPASAEYEHLVRDVGENPETEVLYNHGSFAYHKLRNPRIWDRKKIKKPYEKLKMPNFYLSEGQARSMVTYLLSMKDKNVAADVLVPYAKTTAGKIARGRALVKELNCIGCHTIESDQEANIQQYYSKDPSLSDTDPTGARFMPPLLWGEGAKVQYDWLFTFLNNVEMLRPWLRARMPSFYLTKEDATTLVEYFAALSQSESKALQGDLVPIAKYLQEIHAGGATDKDKPTAATSWFMSEKLEPVRRFLAQYGVNQKQIRANELESPADAPDGDAVAAALSPTYTKLVDRVKFLAAVFDVQYPYSDPKAHVEDDPRFKLGEEFLFSQRCLSCHVAGDPNAKGTTAEIKAPNFALTYKRLRYDWVINWLQDPQAIQPGANMPQIFQGGPAFAGLPEADKDKMEVKYGKSVEEQSTLLVDFLFNLGERRYTAVQPGAAEAAAAPKPAQQVEFDFEGGEKGNKPATSQPAKGGLDF
jgi:mono/diheme cytochrome c family protein